MSQHVANWIEDFLGTRELERPDGRALYAYRCSREEFESLARALAHSPPHVSRTENMPIRAFVLYAAEWWQRKYDGGAWAWEPILASIGWKQIDYPDLYGPVRNAWRWWKVDLVRLPTSIRYLGTFACQGGLPLALVGDAESSVTRYLRAALKHIAAYRRFVDDPIVLAQDQQHLLRPPTLRRDYVFRLAADLIEAVLDLEYDAQDEDPLNALDQARPDWRQTMPLDLEDARARDLLTGLLREAARNRALPADEFHVDRFLRRTGIGWRIGARVGLPASITAETLARQLNVPATELPPRLQVRTAGENPRVIGLYAAQADDFVLPPKARSLAELWDTQATSEIRLEFLGQGLVGEPVIPTRGSALGELPWAFRGTDDCSFIGEGSVANRSPVILVLVPDGCTPDGGFAVDESFEEHGEEPGLDLTESVRILGRTLWRIAEETSIETESGRCVIRPSSGIATAEEYRLSGERFYGFDSPWPLYRGRPTLRFAKADQAARAVPANEVGWRQGRGEWQSHPTGFGLWDVRHVAAGELRHFSRAGILPERFGLSVRPGRDMSEGHLVLTDAEAVMVAGSDPDTEVSATTTGDELRIQVTASDPAAPPVRIRLRLHWPGANELTVQAPFPGHGGRFLREGSPLDHDLATDDLYGVRATALSPNSTQEFWIEGELKALDARELLRVAHFRQPLRKFGVTYELPLIEVRPMIVLLLSGSSSSDAHVALQIVDRYQTVHETTRVSRFAAALECNPELGLVSVSPAIEDETSPTFEAFPLKRPGDDPEPLESGGPADAPHCAVLPQDLDLGEPWLLVMRHDDKIRAQPERVGGSSELVPEPDPTGATTSTLAEALAIEDMDLRTEGLGAAMDAMLEHEDSERTEDEWVFLTDSLLRAEGLPATTLDLLRVLVTRPQLLVRSLFRVDSAPRQFLWRLDDELPFSWLLVRRNTWWREARKEYDRLRKQLVGFRDDHDQMAHDYVVSILSEGSDRLRALDTVSTDVALRLESAELTAGFVKAVLQERDARTPDLIRAWSSENRWPEGYGRDAWATELGKLPSMLWQNPEELRPRQPIFDTPVAAAWCCFIAEPTERTTFLVKRIRAHDRDWFDLAYSAVWFQLAWMQDHHHRENQ